MCTFFSCVSDGKGKVMYFDAKIRKKIIAGKLDYYTDSHTSIADYFGYKGAKEDKLNKYEFNPITRKFVIDQINTTDDSMKVERFCRKLDFKTVVPELIIRRVKNPLKVKRKMSVTKKEIALLKQWDSVWGSAWDSVSKYSAICSASGSIIYSVSNSVGDLTYDFVGGLVWDLVGKKINRYLFRDSFKDLVWAYVSSFFDLPKWKHIKHKKGENPFQPGIDLWEAGLVPSYDGKTWRLHAGPKAKTVYEWVK